MPLVPITNSADLQAACAACEGAPYLCVDTEFLRETTFWPKVCLIQVAAPGVEFLVDPLAQGLSLDPLLALMADPGILKVMHSGRQDIEIFVRLMGAPPTPLWDSQIAAMALGWGESIAYDALVALALNRKVDKTSRFTDWARRPLSEDQLAYALADVTHLRDLYPLMAEKLAQLGRTSWIEQENAALCAPALYDTDPESAWERMKPRRASTETLAALRAACAWRERVAQARDMPRVRVLKDDAVYEVAEQRPRTIGALSRLRSVPKGFAESRFGSELVEAVDAALANAAAYAPRLPPQISLPSSAAPVVEMFKVLLRVECERHKIAPRLVATVADLEAIAMDDDAPTRVLEGWRREVFGARALDLKHGRIAITLKARKVAIVDLPQ